MKYKNFEEYLQWVHAADYVGSGDLAYEAFGHWLEDLATEDLISYGDDYHEARIRQILDELKAARK